MYFSNINRNDVLGLSPVWKYYLLLLAQFYRNSLKAKHFQKDRALAHDSRVVKMSWIEDYQIYVMVQRAIVSESNIP